MAYKWQSKFPSEIYAVTVLLCTTVYHFIKTFKNSNTCVVCGFSGSPCARVMRMKINALKNFTSTLNYSLSQSKYVVNYD